MTVRKKLSAKERMTALAYGSAALFIAFLIGVYGQFNYSGAAAFVVGLFGCGGIYRCIAGHDEI